MESYITKKRGKSGVKKETRLMGGGGGGAEGRLRGGGVSGDCSCTLSEQGAVIQWLKGGGGIGSGGCSCTLPVQGAVIQWCCPQSPSVF